MIEINDWEAPSEEVEILKTLRRIERSLRNIEAMLRKGSRDDGGLVGYLQEQIAMGGPDDVD